MKTSLFKLLTANLAMAIGLVMLASCASPNNKGVATSNALNSSAGAVAQTSSSVTGVLGALNDLTFKSTGDLRNQYDAFVSASKTLDASMANLDSKVAALHVTATDYLNNWTNQTAMIQNEELRKRSADRKDEVAGKINDVETSYQAVKNSLAPFSSDINDIKTYLGTDLTAGGLDTIKDIVSKTKVDAVPLRDSIKQLQGSFTSLSTALSPMMPGSE